MLQLSVISPEKVVFQGEVESVVAPAFDGEVGILQGHAPMVTLLGSGAVRLPDGRHVQVANGFLQVADNHVRIVAERATA